MIYGSLGGLWISLCRVSINNKMIISYKFNRHRSMNFNKKKFLLNMDLIKNLKNFVKFNKNRKNSNTN